MNSVSSRERRQVRGTAYWGFIVIGVGGTILGPALLRILSDFHIAPSGSGALFLTSTIGYMLAVLVGGPASDHFGKRRVLTAGALVYALGLAAFSLTTSWPVAVLTFLVVGAGSGTVDSGMNALINDNSPPEGHAREQSMLHAFFGLGALIGPLLIGALLALKLGWRPAYLISAGGSAVLFMLLLRVRPTTRPTPEGGISIHSVTALARTPIVMLMCSMIFMYVGAELVLGDWAAAYLQRIQGLSSVAAAISVGLFWGALMGGRLLSALLSRWFSGMQLMVGTTFFSLVSSVVLVAAPAAWIALIALFGCGFGFAAIFPLLMAMAGERFPDVTGSVAGLMTASAALAGAALPWISGVLVQVFDARVALSLTPFCSAGLLFALAALHRSEQARLAQLMPAR